MNFYLNNLKDIDKIKNRINDDCIHLHGNEANNFYDQLFTFLVAFEQSSRFISQENCKVMRLTEEEFKVMHFCYHFTNLPYTLL